MQSGQTIVMLAAMLAICACESAIKKCAKANDAAASAWAAYVGELESVRDRAVSVQGASHKRLIDEVDKRLAPQAQQAADARYDRSSEAWLRAYRSGFDGLCTKDAECAGLKQKQAEASAVIEDFNERLPLATAAATAAHGPAAAARKASEAVLLHPEYPQVKAAQELSLDAYDHCKDLPPAVVNP